MNPTEEQLKNRERARLALEQGIPLRNGVPVREPIISEAFEPQEEIELETPETTPFTRAESIPLPTFELTPEQKRQQELIEKTRAEQEKLKGEAAFRTEQEDVFDVPEASKAFKDLSAQLFALQSEAKAIPIQLQQENIGLGRTRAASAVIQADRLRENAIKALTVSATLEATRGNLSFAFEQVDRAVAQKYDPIKETIRVNVANLDLISQSPLATKEEKEEAARVKEEERKRDKEIEKEENNYQAILEASVKAAGIPDIDPLVLRDIKKLLDEPTDENVVEAQRILTENTPKTTNSTGASTDLRTFALLRPDLKIGTPEFQNAFEAFRKKEGGIAVPLTPTAKVRLIGAGFTPQNISQIESDIAEFGIDAVLEGIDNESQKRAIRKEYGVEEPVDIKGKAERAIANAITKKRFSTRTGELQDAIDATIKNLEEFGVVGLTKEQVQEVIDYIKTISVTRDEAKKMFRLKELL